MKTSYSEVKRLASEFLNVADELNVRVSRYLNGSNETIDVIAYEMVKEADKKFVDAVNSYYGERDYEYGLNYELAECFI